MKQLVYYFLILGLVFSCLQACKSDDLCEDTICNVNEVCVDGVCIDAACNVCGTYNGLLSGSYTLSNSTPLDYTDIPMEISFSKIANSTNYNVTMDISNTLGVPQDSFILTFMGVLNGNVVSVNNQVYEQDSITSFMMNGTFTFDTSFSNVNASIGLSNAIDGSMTFSGSKQ
jgi:uncharacterized membrane protein